MVYEHPTARQDGIWTPQEILSCPHILMFKVWDRPAGGVVSAKDVREFRKQALLPLAELYKGYVDGQTALLNKKIIIVSSSQQAIRPKTFGIYLYPSDDGQALIGCEFKEGRDDAIWESRDLINIHLRIAGQIVEDMVPQLLDRHDDVRYYGPYLNSFLPEFRKWISERHEHYSFTREEIIRNLQHFAGQWAGRGAKTFLNYEDEFMKELPIELPQPLLKLFAQYSGTLKDQSFRLLG